MKSKILSILLLLVVVTAFSGVASAASHQVLVKDAYDEQVLVTPAWNETIPEVPAIPAVTHEQLVSSAYWLWHCDISDWIDAVYEDVVVVDVPEVPAWDELITPAIPEVPAYDELISAEIPAWDELISEEVPAYDEAMTKDFNTGTAAHNWIHSLVNSGKIDSEWDAYTTQHRECGKWVYTVHWTEHHDAVPAVYEHHDAVPAVYEHHDAIPEVPAVYLHHDAVPAVTHVEHQLVSEGYYQFLGHMEVITNPDGYSDMISQCSAAYPGWNLISHPHDEFAAVYETVIDVPEVPAVPSYVIEHPAVYETIHHEAVYKTVEDPVVPIVTPDVPEVAEEEPATIPMQHTGSSPYDAAAIVGAALLILGGFGIAAYRRKDDEDEE